MSTPSPVNSSPQPSVQVSLVIPFSAVHLLLDTLQHPDSPFHGLVVVKSVRFAPFKRQLQQCSPVEQPSDDSDDPAPGAAPALVRAPARGSSLAV